MKYILLPIIIFFFLSCKKDQRFNQDLIFKNKTFLRFELENKHAYFFDLEGNDVQSLFFNKINSIGDTIDNSIYLSRERWADDNHQYFVNKYDVVNSLNHEIEVYDVHEKKGARINFFQVNVDEGVWQFEFFPAWEQYQKSPAFYMSNEKEYLFIDKINIDSISVFVKVYTSDEHDPEDIDTAYFSRSFYFKLKNNSKFNYNPVRYVSAPSGLNMRADQTLDSEVIAKLQYNEVLIVNDTLQPVEIDDKKGYWLQVMNLDYDKGYVFSEYLSLDINESDYKIFKRTY